LKLKYLTGHFLDFFTLVKPETSILSRMTSQVMAGLIQDTHFCTVLMFSPLGMYLKALLDAALEKV
jgi:hypothetical protein